MARVFVTGGSGFVGRNLVRALIRRGDEVRALVRSDRAAATVLNLGARPVPGDLDAVAAMQQGMRGCERVFHLAARLGEWGPRAAFYRTNVTGTRNALEAADGAGVGRFVHLSTEAVLVDGHPLVDVDESRPFPARPLPRYPRTKALAEARVRERSGGRLETVIVRPRLVWGRDDTSLLPQLVEAVRSGRFMWIGDGRHRTSTTHVDNVCEGLLAAASRGRPGETYFVTDGEPVEFRSFLTRLLQSQGVDPGDRTVPHWLALAVADAGELLWTALPLPGTPPLTRLVVRLFGEEVTINDSRARRELGYSGHCTLEEGFRTLSVPDRG
ncbi:MAG TPA: NAD-dependent epimerase/dehydratase family protein [Gammaproteobacteria bacterium]|nr:NAD-dependent epimerase/dehydratase family protein [Gammaproteobacteria bacterium]